MSDQRDPSYNASQSQPAFLVEASRFGKPAHAPAIRLSPEEKAVFDQCSKEGFWFRGVPLFLALAWGRRFLAARGIVRKRSMLVSYGIDFGTAAIAMTIGRFSMMGTIKERLMALPDSRMGEELRKGRSPNEIRQKLSSSPEANDAVTAYDPRQADYHRRDKDDYSGNVMDDTNERYRPNMENETGVTQEVESVPPTYSTYDELRRQNRAPHDEKEQQRLSLREEIKQRRALREEKQQQQRALQLERQQQRRALREEIQQQTPVTRTNQYGDVIE